MADIEELDTNFLLSLIRNQLNSFEQTYDALPTLEIQSVYINGSFGGQQATSASDLDVTIELGVVSSEYQMNPVSLVDRIMDFGGVVATGVTDVVPYYADVTVIPSEEILADAGMESAPTAWQHVKQTQSHGGYDTVYDVHAQDYRRI